MFSFKKKKNPMDQYIKSGKKNTHTLKIKIYSQHQTNIKNNYKVVNEDLFLATVNCYRV